MLLLDYVRRQRDLLRTARRRVGQLFFTTKGKSGTGLGLWVTRSIIERYGGALQLYSATGPQRHGTVFSVFLPTNLRPQIVKIRTVGDGDGSGNSEPPKRQRANGTEGKLRDGTTSGPAVFSTSRGFHTVRGGLRLITQR